MSDGQLTHAAAQTYDDFFVPALFADWAPRVADAAGVEAGQRVLDVACGTGVLTRELARRVGPASVVGLDPNEGMLAVARRRTPKVDWRRGHAEALPFGDRSFDVVTCQFGLMFFQDRAAGLRQMWRVLRPGGRARGRGLGEPRPDAGIRSRRRAARRAIRLRHRGRDPGAVCSG